MKPIKSLNELKQLAETDERYQRLCIVSLENIGCDHLAKSKKKWHPIKWQAYHAGLLAYVDSLVGEYGETEIEALQSVIEEVNGVTNCIDQATLDW
jgi:hypothetical protein